MNRIRNSVVLGKLSNAQLLQLMHRFIEIYIETGGNIGKACTAVGITRYISGTLRNNYPEFDRAITQSKVLATETLEDEAIERAKDGTDYPIYYLGKQVGTRKDKSDALMTLLLKARKPEVYGDKSKVIIANNNSGTVIDIIEQAVANSEKLESNTKDRANSSDDDLSNTIDVNGSIADILGDSHYNSLVDQLRSAVQGDRPKTVARRKQNKM